MPDSVVLTLGHSPDPDDAFMWWPLTGMVTPRGEPLPGPEGRPALDTGRFSFKSLPLDIEVLNRRAVEAADPKRRREAAGPGVAPLDITALSVRTWADVQDAYIITSCGASFGDGFGPKVVVRAGNTAVNCEFCLPGLRIAIPGRRTTAFLVLGLVLRSMGIGSQAKAPAGPGAAVSPAAPVAAALSAYVKPYAGARATPPPSATFLELPFERIIPAVVRGDADAGLVIHEGQLTFADAGLKPILDLGQWWKRRTGLKLPLGVNAINKSLDARHGRGTVAEVAALLRRSVAHAMDRWDQSVLYTLPFARANATRAGAEAPTLERIDRYCRMYVSEETRDMGETGRAAIRYLLSEGAAAGMCPAVADLETV